MMSGSWESGRGVSLSQGAWLGIDIGSRQEKVCCFCLIEVGTSGPAVTFERGPAHSPYPEGNTCAALLDPSRPPTYLRSEIDHAVGEVLARSELVGRWLERAGNGPSAVAVDAPVALATEGRSRLTEEASTQTFATPDRAGFEASLREKGDAFHRVNTFWKCVGIAVYGHLGSRLGIDPAELAARTCAADPRYGRLRETFPSDVYKRANGRSGTLAPAARAVLRSLVFQSTAWAGAGPGRNHPSPVALERLRAVRRSVASELGASEGSARTRPLPTMHKRPALTGDFWDAFTCAFTACCEDHGAGVLHGMTMDGEARGRLEREGAILTVRTSEYAAPTGI